MFIILSRRDRIGRDNRVCHIRVLQKFVIKIDSESVNCVAKKMHCSLV